MNKPKNELIKELVLNSTVLWSMILSTVGLTALYISLALSSDIPLWGRIALLVCIVPVGVITMPVGLKLGYTETRDSIRKLRQDNPS